MAAAKAKGKLVSIVINNEYIKICEITKSGKNSTVHKTVLFLHRKGAMRMVFLKILIHFQKQLREYLLNTDLILTVLHFLSVLQDLLLRKSLFLMLKLIK